MKRIESNQNSRIKQWKKLVQQKKERTKTNRYIVEGQHLVEEALKSGQVETVIVAEQVDFSVNVQEVEVIEVTDSIARELAATETSQMVFACCIKKEQPFYDAKGKRYLLIDAVQDPGNVGTLIRTADAAGVDGVVIGKGSADIYSPKVLRAAQGSTFHVPLYEMELDEAFQTLQCLQIPIYATGWTTQAKPYNEVSKDEGFALIVGNEGNGVAPYYMERADEVIFIPMYGQAESLNVGIAAGIVLFHYRMK